MTTDTIWHLREAAEAIPLLEELEELRKENKRLKDAEAESEAAIEQALSDFTIEFREKFRESLAIAKIPYKEKVAFVKKFEAAHGINWD